LKIEKHLSVSDWELLVQLQRKADERRNGRLTICKFTTNWRVPNSRDDIANLHEGATFTVAAMEALRAE
jgi:hypothetical protein